MRHRNSDDAVEARAVVQEFGGWIRNADTKATILLGATGVLVAALLGRASSFGEVLRSESEWRCVLVIAALVVVVSLIALAVFLVLTIRPRIVASEFSRYAWPRIAAMPEVPKAFDTGTAAAEAWVQAHVLARIARAKYDNFNRSLVCFGGAVVSFAVFLAVLDIPDHGLAQ